MARENLTRPPLENGDLAARMSAFTDGQVTWPSLSLRASCATCDHYAPQKKGWGICALVKVHTRKPGKAFDGNAARACSLFSGRK